MKKKQRYFTTFEIWLWVISYVFILGSFLIFKGTDYMTLIATLLGVVSLTFVAKGNLIGPFIMIIFCILYGIVSYSFGYYGEVMTYLFMSLPMSVWTFFTWLKNPFKGNKAEVTVGSIGTRETVFMFLLSLVVTVVFYYILSYFNTANLLPSTLSVTTSFLAAYLSARRSPYYALAYAANDIVLIVLWVLAARTDITYVSVIVCFLVFLVYDLYGFYSWLNMKQNQQITA